MKFSLRGAFNHVYLKGTDAVLKTSTPTYENILENGANVIPEGKRSCIVRAPRAGSFYILQFTKNADIPPEIFRAVDRLKYAKTADDVRAQLHRITAATTSPLPNVNYRSKIHRGGTMLHAAAAAYDVRNPALLPQGLMASILSVTGLDTSVRNKSGQTALHIAAKAGSLEAVDALLDTNQELHAIRDNDGKTAFEAAVSPGGRAAAVRQRLYDRYPRVYDSWKPTALKEAIVNPRRFNLAEIRNLLANKKLDINYRFPDVGGKTLLHMAVDSLASVNLDLDNLAHGRELVKLLLNYPGVDPNMQDDQGRTVLHHAASHTSNAALNLLSQFEGIDFNIKDAQGRTPLLYALSQYSESEENNNAIPVNILVSTPSVSLDDVDDLGMGILHHAARSRFPVTDRFVASIIPEANRVDHSNRSPVHHAVEANSRDFLRIAIENEDRINLNIPDQRGWTPLHMAVVYNRPELVDDLLNSNSVIANSRDHNNLTPLHLAIRNGLHESLDTLLRHDRVNVNLPFPSGEAPLHLAIKDNLDNLADRLLRRRDLDLDARESNGRNPMHYAAAYGREKTLRQLAAIYDGTLNSYDSNSCTPLHLAVQNTSLSPDLLRTLLSGPLVNPNIGDSTGLTPLHLAVAGRMPERIHLLATNPKVNPNTLDNKSRTPLHHGVLGNSAAVLNSLLESGRIDVNSYDVHHETPLHLALKQESSTALDILLRSHGIDVNARDANGATPLHFVAGVGRLDIIERLLACSDIQVNLQGPLGRTALHCAVSEGREDIVEKLLGHSAISTNLQDANGQTPLHLEPVMN